METRPYDEGPARSAPEDPARAGLGRDRVTGLWGPGPFASAVDRQAAIALRHERPGGVVVIGVRGLGGVEDDDLRRAVAGALRSRLRATDMVARLDDAAFGVLLVEAQAGAARAVAGQLVDAVAAVVGPAMSVAAGITVFPDGGPRSGAGLLADAEVALLEAAESSAVAVAFESGLGARRETRGAPASRAERLRRALEHDDWVLACRPVVEVETDVVLQQDLFVARRRADGSVVGADELLLDAERFGRARALDACVLDRVVELAAQRVADEEVGQLRVTLSGAAIADGALVRRLIERLIDRPEAAPALVFALAERDAVADVALARTFVARLGEFGCCFALDDFGAAFGSVTLLRDLPVDYLGLAPGLVRGLATSDRDRAIALAIVEAADALGTAAIAKGVDDEEVLVAARGFGIPLAQGGCFDASEFEAPALDCRPAARA
jgi:EAL domain-containing protein (putative c-di-GMP-specific phosphodiesterase class I)/GGDEF domain-containing protein